MTSPFGPLRFLNTAGAQRPGNFLQGGNQFPRNFFFGAQGGPGATITDPDFGKFTTNLFTLDFSGELLPHFADSPASRQLEIIDVGQGPLNQTVPQAISERFGDPAGGATPLEPGTFALRIPAEDDAADQQTLGAPISAPEAERASAPLAGGQASVRQRRARGRTFLQEPLGGDILLGA